MRAITDFVSGWAVAQIFLAALLLIDSNGITGLLMRSGDPVLPLLMLSLALGGLLGIAALATGLGAPSGQSRSPRRRLPAIGMSVATLPARRPRR